MRSGPSELAAALAALGIDVSSANGQGWATALCPACGQPGTSQSLRVNVNSGAYKCYRCGATSQTVSLGDFVLNPVIPSLREQAAAGTGPKRSELPELTVALVERYARFLRDSPSVVSDLERKRGWTPDTMEKLNIGWDGSHLWIPVYDITGHLVNARLYDPFKRTKVKSLHYANDTGLRRTAVWAPFGKASLEAHSSVWLFEGEPDAILAAQMGFPAAVITGGAGTWCDELPSIIGTKRCVFCYDMDAAGRRGSRSHSSRLRNMGHQALDLSFELSNPSEMNDFTDAVLKDKRDAAWFRALAKSQWGEGAPPSSKAPMRVKLGGGVPGERLSVRAHVAGTHTVPLLVPQIITARCRVDWQPDRACRSCPIATGGGTLKVDIEPESQDLMLLAATPVRMQDMEFKRLTGAPVRCPRVEHEATNMWQVQPIKLIPPMNDRAGGDSTIRSGMAVCPADGRPPPVRANQLYEFDGRVMPDVRTNEWTLVTSESLPAEDDVDSFRMTDSKAAAFSAVFRPDEWTVEAVEDVLSREERSLARHVTKVYGRDLLLRAVDLVYHSALSFKFRGSVSSRGWMSVGVIGDTRCGKSETYTSMLRYFGFGAMLNDASNTTFAGIVGGLQQVGSGDKAWVVTWGLAPTNDRGMVILDEISAMSTDDIGRMSGMRSSGVAELTKIRNASTPARVRMIMSGNPRGSGMVLSSFGTPAEGLMELIGAPEDVARFDFGIGVKGGLDKEAAGEALGDQPLPIDIGLRRDLIRFAWSRRQDHIEWEEGAEQAAVRAAASMVAKYDSSIPLVEPSEQDLRIARVAVAVAIRTYSTTDDQSTVLVRCCHVEFAHRMLVAAFDGDLAYDRFSKVRSRMRLDESAAKKLVLGLHRNPAMGARALMILRRVTVNSVGMALGMNAEEARTVIASLTQIGAAEFSRDDKGANTSLVWTPKFASMLRDIEENPPKRDSSKDEF